jgi:glycine cleavage system pyridoxal-binding protein P
MKVRSPKFFVDNEIFPQTKDVIVTRATPLGIRIVFGDYKKAKIDNTFFGAIVNIQTTLVQSKIIVISSTQFITPAVMWRWQQIFLH